MKAIYGLYNTPDAAQRAFDGLRAEGLPMRGISIMSSEPLEEWEFASHDHETVMPWIAVIGGGLGLIAAYLPDGNYAGGLGDQHRRHADRYRIGRISLSCLN